MVEPAEVKTTCIGADESKTDMRQQVEAYIHHYQSQHQLSSPIFIVDCETMAKTLNIQKADFALVMNLENPMSETQQTTFILSIASEVPATEWIKNFKTILTTLETAFKTLKVHQEKSQLIEELKLAAVTDPLTMLFNRKKLNETLEANQAIVERYQRPCSIILLDIDDFKAVNDNFGHNEGDLVLLELGRILQENSRKSDTVGRWGGEEFLIILPETTLASAEEHANLLCQKIANSRFSESGQQTASFGVGALLESQSMTETIKRVDNAMYSAKKQGKNRVVVANTLN